MAGGVEKLHLRAVALRVQHRLRLIDEGGQRIEIGGAAVMRHMVRRQIGTVQQTEDQEIKKLAEDSLKRLGADHGN